MTQANNTSKKLTGSDVVEYKDRLYSVRWTNEAHGLFLVPIKTTGEDLGFWAPTAKCKRLNN